jgi:NAD(P)-dependent dehydrogenase (short-subunit alcohol dehydrogenase family)
VTNSTSALITGSSRGLGLGIAVRLAERGFGLTIAGRDARRLSDVAATLRECGSPDVSFRPGDVMDDDYVAALVDSHADRFGGCNALVVNAGVGSAGPLADFHVKRFDKQIAVNLRSAYVLMQRALPMLRATATGGPHGAKIVAMASLTGVYAEPELSAYGAAKAGLMSLCRSINLEENVNGVSATALAPGYVDTDMTEFKHGVLDAHDMITVNDVVEVVDMCLRLSRRAIIPEVVIARSGTAGLEA